MANSETITINVKAIADMSDVLSNTKQIQNALNQLKLPANLTTQFNQNFSNIEREAAKVQAILSKPVKTKADLTGLESSFKKINTDLIQLQNGINKINPTILRDSFQIDTSKLVAAREEVQKLEQTLSQNIDASGLQNVLNAYKQLTEQGHKSKFAEEFTKAFQAGDINAAEQALAKLNNQLKQFEGKAMATGSEKWAANVKDYSDLISVFTDQLKSLKENSDISPLIQQLGQAREKLASLSEGQWQEFLQAFQNQGPANAIQLLINYANQYEDEIRGATSSQANFNSEVDQVKNRIKYFLGLNNAVNLFRRAVRQAFETVKELDKAMTETAVVTDYTVGDMWGQLPRYTKTANELGVTTKGAYETMTLFYQQGLDTNQAFEIGTETMKMARIAGLDYADATDAMTAALRGFNMELTDTSAKRVNDVYSQLAAKTASNVEEISTAMTKTASIAHNAGMEFETTSAYLSQIIETTREAPETAGTALKTVIARFTELKKPLEEIGEVEGEVVDANKIETALKSVGVALRDSEGQFRNLDDVFLDLNAKWDSLTKNQQRYIATMAAGSRQQSRFIAMMSDYGRTQELISEAYDSAGASQKQYEKTLDSLESKLNRLKNAWNEFLMGITDSSLIKGFVDMLTNLLNGVNKFSDLFGEKGSGIVKALTALLSWKVLRSILGQSKNGLLSLIFGKTEGAKTVVESLTNITKKIQQCKLSMSGLSGAVASTSAAAVSGEAAASAGLAGIIGQLGTILAELAPILAIALALAAAGYGIYQAWKQWSFEGKIKQAQELQESFKNLASNAENTRKSLEGAADTYKELTQAIEDAATAEERANAVRERNEYVNSLLQENKDYANFLESTMDVNGQLNLTLNEDALAASIAKAQEAVTRANAGISFAAATEAGLRAQQANRQMDRYDFNKETGKVDRLTIDDKVIQYAGETQERATNAYINYMTTAEQATAEMIQQATNGYLQMLEGKDLEGSTAEGIARVMAENFNAADYLGFINSLPGQIGLNEHDYEAEARELGASIFGFRGKTGYTQDALERLYTARYGQLDTNLDSSALLTAIKQYDYTQQQQEQIDHLADLVQEAPELYNSIYSAIDGFKNTTQNLTLLQPGTSIADVLGLDLDAYTEALNAIAGGDQKKINELNNNIEQNLKLARQQQYDKLVSTGATFERKGFVSRGFNLDKFFKLEDTADQDFISNILSNIDNANLGARVGNIILAGMKDADWEGSALQQWISSIDFSNPLTTMAALQEGTSNLNKEISNVAKRWYNVAAGTAEYSAEAQVQYVLLSESFNELNEDLDEFTEKNGKISGTNIESLRGQCKNLDLLLKNNAISAQGLANILNAIGSEGTLSIMDINGAMIAAANSMGTLDNTIQKTLDGLSGFDPGYDENDVTGFISDAYDLVSEQMEKGAYGNNQMRQYMDFIFGPESLAGKSGDEYINQLKTNMAWLKANKENMYSAWHNAIAAAGDGVIAAEDGLYNAMEVYEKNGEIFIDTNGNNAEQVEAALIKWGEGIGLSAQQVKMMLVDFSNYSAEYRQEIAANELPQAIEKWQEALGKTATGEKYATTDQINALKLLAQQAGYTDKQVEELIQGLEGFKVVDTTGVKDTIGELQKLGYYTGTYTKQKGERTFLNLDQIKSDLQQAGLYSQEALNEIIDSQIGSLGDGVTSFWANINGEMTEITIEEGQTASEALAAALEKSAENASFEAMGEAMGKGFLQAAENGSEAIEETGSAAETAAEKLTGLVKAFGDQATATDTATESLQKHRDALLEVQEASGNVLGTETTNTVNEKHVQTNVQNNEVHTEETVSVKTESDTEPLEESQEQLQEFQDQAEEDTEIGVANDEGLSKIGEIQNADKNLSSALATNKSIGVSNTFALAIIKSVKNTWENWVPTIKYLQVVYKKSGDTGSGAKGGYVSSYATGGNRNRIKPGRALTGEEGPEIVWNKEKGYAYITGAKHPEFQILEPGDQIFNAKETKKILGSAADGGKVPSYAGAYSGVNKSSSSSGSSSRSSSSSSSSVSSADFQSFRNDLDWLFNLVEDIAELERQQTRLDENLESLLHDNSSTLKEVYQVAVQQLGNLYAQLRSQETMLSKREQEMTEFMREANLFPEYLQYNWKDNTLEIAWDEINQIINTDVSNKVQDLVSRAQEIQSSIEEAEDAVAATKKTISDFGKIYRDSRIDLEQRVVGALVQVRQEIIDNYSILNDTLTNTNNNIISAIQKEVDLQRQIRDNTKTEEEITDLEAQIAFLARDTTGSNQQKLLQLQEELDNKRESYEDTLVDQSISKLQDDNEKAEEQRKQQIDIMQAQLDYQEKSGYFNEEAQRIITEGTAALENHSINSSELLQLLQKTDNWDAMTGAQKSAWADEILEAIKSTYLFDISKTSKYQSDVEKATEQQMPASMGNVEASKNTMSIETGSRSQSYETVGYNPEDYDYNVYTLQQALVDAGYSLGKYKPDGYYGDYTAAAVASFASDHGYSNESGKNPSSALIGEIYKAAADNREKAQAEGFDPTLPLYNYNRDLGQSSSQADDVFALQSALQYLGYDLGGYQPDGIFGKYTLAAAKAFQKDVGIDSGSDNWLGYRDGQTLDLLNEAVKKQSKGESWKRYKKGGLANFTGPAWLDGTKTKPEAVLNNVQTEAFLKLAEVLPALMKSEGGGTSTSYGDINLKLIMNVEEIGSDYDVDRIADRVKEIIYNASSYRNVNTLNFIR